MLKQPVEEVQAERDEALPSVGSLQRWLYQARRDAGLDVHGQDLEMAVENHTAHLPIDIQYHPARNRKINTLEAKVASLTEQLHNAGKLLHQIGGRLCDTSEVIRLIRCSSLANNQPSDTMATMMIKNCGVHASLRRLCGHENASFSQLSHLCHKLLCRLLTCQYDQLRRESTDKRVIIPGLVIKNGSCAAELYEGLATHRYNPALEFRRAAQG